MIFFNVNETSQLCNSKNITVRITKIKQLCNIKTCSSQKCMIALLIKYSYYFSVLFVKKRKEVICDRLISPKKRRYPVIPTCGSIIVKANIRQAQTPFDGKYAYKTGGKMQPQFKTMLNQDVQKSHAQNYLLRLEDTTCFFSNWLTD